MCVVSMVGDHYNEKFEPYKHYVPNTYTDFLKSMPITREEFEKLEAEVKEMKELLKRAKIYDQEHDEPNCEIEDKMAFLRQVAGLVGINLDDVIKTK